MATQVKHRRGNQTEIDNFTPAIGEIVMNTDTNELILGDGATKGGHQVTPSKSVDSVSVLITTNLRPGEIAKTKSYRSGWAATSIGAIGGATYLIKTTAQAAVNGDVIDGYANHMLDNGNVAILIIDDNVNILKLGASPNDDSEAGAEANYFAITEGMKLSNFGGTVLVPHVAGIETITRYPIDRTIEISSTGVDVTAVSVVGSASELVFIQRANVFTGTALFRLLDANSSARWGNKFKDLVFKGKSQSQVLVDKIWEIFDSSILGFDNSYFEFSSGSNVHIRDSFSIEFIGGTTEQASSHVLFENEIKDVLFHNWTFNGGAPFSFVNESGNVEVEGCKFNSLSGGVSINLMNFRNNRIKDPNGTTKTPIIIYRGNTKACYNNQVFYTGSRVENAECIVRVDSVDSDTVNVFNNTNEGVAPAILYLNNPYNIASPVKFFKSSSSFSNYYFQYQNATDEVKGFADSSKFVRYYQDGAYKLSTPTNSNETFVVGNNQSLVYDFSDNTFKVIDSEDKHQLQIEIGLRLNDEFVFTCEDLHRRDSVNSTANIIFAYDDRYTSG